MSIGILLTILFVALKLLGYIAWPWLWVAMPLIVEVVITILIFAVAGMIYGWAFRK